MKKNVLLISPHSTAGNNESRYVSPALGVNRIAGWLNADGHHTVTFDPNLPDLDDKCLSLEWILDRKWDIIGFSVLEDTLFQDIQNMWLARQINSDALFVAGGIEAQYNYQTILDKTPCTIVVLGEGEKPMLDLCEDKPLHKIPGIVFKNKAKALKPESFETANNLIAWEDINYEAYWDYYMKKYGKDVDDQIMQQIHTIRVFSRNRCPFECKFCSSTNQLPDATGKNITSAGMSIDGLIKIIKRIKGSHRMVRTIYLTDDDFCLNKSYVIEFCQTVIREGLNDLSYMCFARINDITAEMLKWMKKAGFRRLNIGIESFSDKVLKEVGKHYSVDEAVKNLWMIKDHGIQTFMTLMLITPLTKLEDLEVTLKITGEFISDPWFTAGLSAGIRPTKGSSFYEEYYNFQIHVSKIPGQPYFIKENKTIYAKDPLVQEIQKKYILRESYIVYGYLNEKDIKHATFSNIAEVQLDLMLECIDKIKEKYGLN